MKQNRKGFARLLEMAGEKRGLLLLAALLSALSAVCMLLPYVAVYAVLSELLASRATGAPPDGALLVRWGWTALWAVVAGLALLYAALMASHVAAFRLLYALRVRLADHIGRLSLGYLSTAATGAIKKTMEQNVERIETFIAHTIPDLVNVGATLAVMFVLFLTLDWRMALVAFAVTVLAIAVQFSAFMGRRARQFVAEYYDAQERLGASAVEYVRGMSVVRVFGRSVFSLRRFREEVEAYRRFALKLCDTYEGGMVAFAVLLSSIVTFLLPVGLLLWQGGAGSLAFAAVWLFFIVLGPGTAAPVWKLMFLGSGTREIDEGVKRIDRILAEAPLPEPDAPREPHGSDVEFRQVTFAYCGADGVTSQPALENLSFVARQGTVTALVGPSGSGKSTVANLIPRFWDVDSGAVLVGGVDVRQIATERLMNLVSFVFQDTFLFDDTIRANIAAGRPDATDADVERAARAAQCHDFIQRLPQGYATLVGGGGVRLSGGEAQRVCVARAILKDAPILVLDEATAFADAENEHRMQQAISRLAAGKTVIVVAHRLSTVVGADQIVVLDGGCCVERGRHAELMARGGLYARMWAAYTSASHWQMNQASLKN